MLSISAVLSSACQLGVSVRVASSYVFVVVFLRVCVGVPVWGVRAAPRIKQSNCKDRSLSNVSVDPSSTTQHAKHLRAHPREKNKVCERRDYVSHTLKSSLLRTLLRGRTGFPSTVPSADSQQDHRVGDGRVIKYPGSDPDATGLCLSQISPSSPHILRAVSP